MVHTQRRLHCTVNDKMGKARNRKKEKKTSVQKRIENGKDKDRTRKEKKVFAYHKLRHIMISKRRKEQVPEKYKGRRKSVHVYVCVCVHQLG